MKTRILLPVILCITIFLLNTSFLIEEPYYIGKQSFTMLRNITKRDRQVFTGHYLSFNEIHKGDKQLIKDDYLGMDKFYVSEDNWKLKAIIDYILLRRKGALAGIKWQNIRYVDFVYNINANDGVTGCEGVLFFKYKKRTFSGRLNASTAVVNLKSLK